MDRPADYDISMSNEELLELCVRQDQEALRVLFRRHERPVYSLLLRMLNNREDAEEALAEVFVKVWKSAKDFKGGSKFTTWLYKIASNTARDFLRYRKVRPETAVDDSLLTEIDHTRQTSTPGDPFKLVVQAEERDLIVKAMQGLSEEDRLLITLYHFQEMDYDEVVKITGTSPANLKVKLFRARQRLKKLCAEQEEDNDNGEMRTNTTESAGLRQGSAERA